MLVVTTYCMQPHQVAVCTGVSANHCAEHGGVQAVQPCTMND
jgi:hypothetical protein